jgi:hypothetical protein
MMVDVSSSQACDRIMMSRPAGAAVSIDRQPTPSNNGAAVMNVKSLLREIVKKVPLLGRSFVQRDELRLIVQKLWEPPGHFYSPIPDVAEIRRSEENVFELASRDIAGIDLNEIAQLQLLEALVPFYRDQPFAAERREGFRYFFENNAFSYFDAVVFHCLIRHIRPRRVIEVGSGYSSCALLDTNERFFDDSIACTFIEPYPQLLTSLITERDRARTRLIARNLQDVAPDVFLELSANDILFIDSSHVVKTHSDVNYVFYPLSRHLSSVRVPEGMGLPGTRLERGVSAPCVPAGQPSLQHRVLQFVHRKVPPRPDCQGDAALPEVREAKHDRDIRSEHLVEETRGLA